MSISRFIKWSILLFCIIPAASAQTVSVVQKNNTWRLMEDGKPIFIKGVVGNNFLERIKKYGGNSVRTGWHKQQLDQMNQLGLTALVNLPVKAERDGMNYDDTMAVRKQTEKIVDIVKQTKNNPAVLMWAVGNELDFIPGDGSYNLKLWNAINQIAKAIHHIDPNHPVMTVIGTGRMEKLTEIKKRCPDIDLIGINAYGDIYTLPKVLKQYGWTKPYVITEWGPDGYWEVPKTAWKAPYEQTGLEKYLAYQKKYLAAIGSDNGQCLGSYVFYWAGFKQETTHTWFCMFNTKGMESPMVGLMQYLWSGQKPVNVAPIVDSLNIAGFVRYHSIYLEPGAAYPARVVAGDADGDPLAYVWEIRPEAIYASYAGQGEQVPEPIRGLIGEQHALITFRAPAHKGAYRLFVYAYDGKNHFSTANLPFYVK